MFYTVTSRNKNAIVGEKISFRWSIIFHDISKTSEHTETPSGQRKLGSLQSNSTSNQCHLIIYYHELLRAFSYYSEVAPYRRTIDRNDVTSVRRFLRDRPFRSAELGKKIPFSRNLDFGADCRGRLTVLVGGRFRGERRRRRPFSQRRRHQMSQAPPPPLQPLSPKSI